MRQQRMMHRVQGEEFYFTSFIYLFIYLFIKEIKCSPGQEAVKGAYHDGRPLTSTHVQGCTFYVHVHLTLKSWCVFFYSWQGEPVLLQPKDKDNCNHNPPRGALQNN